MIEMERITALSCHGEVVEVVFPLLLALVLNRISEVFGVEDEEEENGRKKEQEVIEIGICGEKSPVCCCCCFSAAVKSNSIKLVETFSILTL